MVNITINGASYEMDEKLTILQACEEIGIQIPRFCYHEALSIAGNCRMCLVNVKGSRKPVASCSAQLTEGMEVSTDTPEVKDVRKRMMEMLLINHPLDCPVCDQGGECDLQDQAVRYGLYTTRFDDTKRVLNNKTISPLISTHMTRCILCTRCIRFAREIGGVYELGAIGRGDHTEITNYVNEAVKSEMSGNLVDVCPVGALNNSQYEYTARPWEMNQVSSISIMDGAIADVYGYVRGDEVMRFLPQYNFDINEEWLDDRSRYIIDGIKSQRIDKPMIKRNGSLVECSWEEALGAITDKLKHLNGSDIAVIAGDTADTESAFAIKKFISAMGGSNFIASGTNVSTSDDRRSYLFNSKISGIDKADAILIIGSNLRVECPVINTRIRKRYLNSDVKIGLIGPKLDLKYEYNHLGSSPAVLKDILSGNHEFSSLLKNAKNPMIICGESIYARGDKEAVLHAISSIVNKFNIIRDDWNGFNSLSLSAGSVGLLDLGYNQSQKNVIDRLSEVSRLSISNKIKVSWMLNASGFDSNLVSSSFSIYQGHHGDAIASSADVVLPSSLWIEKNSSYVNTEGLRRYSNKVVSNIGESKEDWTVIRAIAEKCGVDLQFNNVEELRDAMFKEIGSFESYDDLNNTGTELLTLGSEGDIIDTDINYVLNDYYLNNIISKSSAIMSRCSMEFNK